MQTAQELASGFRKTSSAKPKSKFLSVTVSLGLASFGSHTAVGTGTTLGTVGGRPTLRLTFGADGKLQAAQEVGR